MEPHATRHASSDPGIDVSLDREAFERSMRSLHWPLRWFDTQVEGIEHLPEGPALLIGNHGPMGIDAPFLIAAIHERTGRATRGLLDRIWLTSAPTRALARRAGCLLASRETALAALAQGDWVLNYPGGVPEAMRGPDERYQLRWEGRTGFIKVALQAQVPIVPVACIGIDDMCYQVIDHDHMTRTAWGRWVSELVGERYVPPLMVGPLLGELRFWIGKPIRLPYGRERANDSEALMSGKRQVQRALESLMAEGLRDREQNQHTLWRERLRRRVTPLLDRARARLR